MRDYDGIYREMDKLSSFEKSMLLMSIFHEFEISEQWEMEYTPKRFFENTIPEELNRKTKSHSSESD
ncbi:hypothetical protein WMZ97_13025 [Lentibacillus sp. N15]|uniref:hypothetical protein n=1 Tax=Lentibacillus songyuanensis TaxID=3136161 RepID=UPI0031BBC38C